MGHSSSMRAGGNLEVVAWVAWTSVSEAATRDGCVDGRVRVSSPGWEEAVSTFLKIHLWTDHDL